MKLSVKKSALKDVLKSAAKVARGNHTIATLSGVFLEAREGCLSVKATDLDMEFIANIPAEVHEPGEALVDAKTLNGIVNKGPQEIGLSRDGATLTVNAGGTFKLQCMDTENYPELAAIGDDLSFAKLTGFSKVVYAAAKGDLTRPALAGVYIDGPAKAIIATDGYRVAIKQVDIHLDRSILVPAEAIMFDEVEFAVTEHSVVFRPEANAYWVSRLIQAQFPRYEQVLPTEFSRIVSFDRLEFVEILERAMLINDSQVQLSIDREQLQVKATSETGEMEAGIQADLNGDPLRIWFNPRFLLDGLKAAEEERLTMKFTLPDKPAVMEEDGWLYIVLPLRPDQGV